MYRAVTHKIEVVVTPRFVSDKSSPENNYFFWAYTISITNNGAETVQLYVADDATHLVVRPVKELKAFRKVTLRPGETTTVTFTLTPRDFSHSLDKLVFVQSDY